MTDRKGVRNDGRREFRVPADPVTLEGILAKKLAGYQELVIEYNGAIKETIEMKDD